MKDTDREVAVTVYDNTVEAVHKWPGIYPMKEIRPGEELLVFATHAGAELVQAFIDKGADINARDEDGRTPLMRAVLHAAMWQGRFRRTFRSVVKTLIRNGADVNLKDHEGNTALSMASALGLRYVVRLLEADA